MRKISPILLLLLAAAISPAQKSIRSTQPSSAIDLEHARWIDSVMRSILTIKPGATRVDLLAVFAEEGGMSNRTHRKYVYKQCPYIKVDVVLAPVGKPDDLLIEMPEDKIITISRPYLEYSIFD
jgi:hypothetical protein